MSDAEVEVCSTEAPPAKRPRLAAAGRQFVDLTGEMDGCSYTGRHGAPRIRQQKSNASSSQERVPVAGAHPAARLGSLPNRLAPHASRPHACSTGRQQRQHHSDGADVHDFELAKQLQDEEQRAADKAETLMLRSFEELEAAEAATEAELARRQRWGSRPAAGGAAPALAAAAVPGSRTRSRGGLSALLAAAHGSEAAAAAAGGADATGMPWILQTPVGSRGPWLPRARPSHAAEAGLLQAAAETCPVHSSNHAWGAGGRRGAFLGGFHALQQMMAGLSRGLPADLLLSGRDFTHADYEQLLALDRGNTRTTATKEAVAQLETVRVPYSGLQAQPAAAAATSSEETQGSCSRSSGSRSSSPPAELGTCVICLEGACPGDTYRVLGCRHAFHCRCIDRWLTQERNTCPICQRMVV